MGVAAAALTRARQKRQENVYAQLTGTSISGNSFSNLSISSSPVTFTTVSFRTGGAASKSNEKPLSCLTGGAAGRGMSTEPSSEMSGKAEAARSRSMSSPNKSPMVNVRN